LVNLKEESSYFLAATSRCFNAIPHNIITENILLEVGKDGDSVLGVIIDNDLNDIDARFLTEEILLKKSGSVLKPTYLHYIAASNSLDKIKPEILTEENLLKTDASMANVYHYAARWSALGSIPKNILTRKALCSQNSYGETPVHWATGSGDLDQIPKDLINNEILCMKDEMGNTCFHNAATSTSLHQIPEKLLTEENMTKKNVKEETPLKTFLRYYNSTRDKSIAKAILQRISTELLKTLRVNNNNDIKKLCQNEITKRALSPILNKEVIIDI
jgi:ankyrin repeat protein